ncbi:MAG: methyltransferase [Coriobacteriaceae bacterium]|nr:methyltransferase [Coriobacteriaceae bacterium]
MLTLRENALAILHGKQPDKYDDFMNAMQFLLDPIWLADRVPQDGEFHKDSWGVTKCFLPGAPGPHPHITPENIVCKNIEEWEKYVIAPDIDALDWTDAREQASQINRDEKFVGLFSATGIFERSHFLMGMEDAFCNYLEYPEEMTALINYLADWKIKGIYRAGEEVRPDVVFYQDDWGSKQNLFLPPAVWREIIKPATKRISDAIHDIGALYVHHADCYCQPIVEDMVELGVDIWQGVIPENDIVEIKRITNNKLAMIGGIDVPYCDRENATEEEIRSHVREKIDLYCPGGYFFPGLPSGACLNAWNDSICRDELDKYGRQWAQEHPVV